MKNKDVLNKENFLTIKFLQEKISRNKVPIEKHKKTKSFIKTILNPLDNNNKKINNLNTLIVKNKSFLVNFNDTKYSRNDFYINKNINKHTLKNNLSYNYSTIKAKNNNKRFILKEIKPKNIYIKNQTTKFKTIDLKNKDYLNRNNIITKSNNKEVNLEMCKELSNDYISDFLQKNIINNEKFFKESLLNYVNKKNIKHNYFLIKERIKNNKNYKNILYSHFTDIKLCEQKFDKLIDFNIQRINHAESLIKQNDFS